MGFLCFAQMKAAWRGAEGAAITWRVTADELDHAFTTSVTEHEHAWFLGSLRF